MAFPVDDRRVLKGILILRSVAPLRDLPAPLAIVALSAGGRLASRWWILERFFNKIKQCRRGLGFVPMSSRSRRNLKGHT
jgi:hypothetical protein